jgi:hypothetical protein
MKKITCAAVVVLAGLSWFGAREIARGEDAAPVVAKGAAAPDALSQISIDETAGKLAVWARSNHDAIGLAMAARVLASAPPAPMENPQKVKSPAPADAPAVDPTPFTPAALLAEAKGMTSDADILSAIAQIEKSMPPVPRSAVNGARDDHDVLPPKGTTTYDIIFAGGEPMELAIWGSEPRAVDYRVFDEEGNEMKSEICEHFKATPKKTQHFKIVISNTASDPVTYWFTTN